MCTDSEYDINLIHYEVLTDIIAAKARVRVNKFRVPRKYWMAVSATEDQETLFIESYREADLTLELKIRHGRTTVELRNTRWCVAVGEMNEAMLNRPFTEELGLGAPE